MAESHVEAKPSDPAPGGASRVVAPPWMFALQVSYLALLVALALAYYHLAWLRHAVPNPAGPVPLGVPWWGALGGVTISFTGIFRNANRWQSSYQLWHIARPLLGAVVGSVGYLIFIAVIRAAGLPTHAGPQAGTGSNVVFYLMAFITGYREEIFREMLKRATDSLLMSRTAGRPD
jgi:hypothetical protein